MTIDNWHNRIDKMSLAFDREFSSLTARQLNWKPNEQTWSIAQNVDHLITINETYYPVLNSAREGTLQLPFIARLGFMVHIFGKSILKSVSPDRAKKMTTFPIWEPSVSEIPGHILSSFSKHQQQLKAMIAESDELLDKNAVIYSPANKNIVYRLNTAFEILVTHEERHFAQAKEVKDAMNL